MSETEKLVRMAYDLSREEGGEKRFWQQFSGEVLQIGTKEFLTAYMKNYESRYFVSLLLSLPQLWQDFTVDDWLKLMRAIEERPRHPKKGDFGDVGVHADIRFLCRFLEIDGLDLYLRSAQASEENKLNTIRYMKGFLDEFVKERLDYEDLGEGEDNVFDGFTLKDLDAIKQRLLRDPRAKEFPRDEPAARAYVEQMYQRYEKTAQVA